MNSEELEQSLRTEFEAHLKQVFADVQQEIAGLQENIEQEFERHRTQLTEAFESFSARASAGSEKELDAGFRESIVEHLRQSRDEGARITATAIAEAEDMERESAAAAAEVAAAPVFAGISELRDGINDVCSQTSQAAILKSLVSHAGQFTPRGAFFIVKNEHFVGWRVFGREEQDENEAVREIFFPVSDETTPGESLKSMNAVESSFGANAGDSAFLDKLEFGEPEKMVAIPLITRGRGVAVLYADRGANGEEINVEALETLVRVAGLTVEVLAAAAPGAARQSSTADLRQADNFVRDSAPVEQQEEVEEKESDAGADYQTAEDSQTNDSVTQFDYSSPTEAVGESTYQPESSDNDYSGEGNYQSENTRFDSALNDYATEDYSVEEITDDSETPVQAEEFKPVYQEEQAETESYSWNQPAAETTDEEPVAAVTESESEYGETESYSDAGGQYQFEDGQSLESSDNQFGSEPQVERDFESAEYGAPSFEQPAQDFAPATGELNYGSFEPQRDGATAAESEMSGFGGSPAEEIAEVRTAKPARSRFSDKNIDLPVEVSEDERRLHNDARRFARLLVSEIKLYNEQKVKEGRDESDLYERLREAIDRSREMYDKRVQPPVAAKFDYFHYELVNSLAEGDAAKLGERYVGAVV